MVRRGAPERRRKLCVLIKFSNLDEFVLNDEVLRWKFTSDRIE